MRYKIWIDRGGTFTDCICLDTLTQHLQVAKLLSGSSSIIQSIRRVLGLDDEQAIPPCDVRMGTTIATNALLERKGRSCLLVTTRGLGDVLEIGTQARADLFDLNIVKPEPLCHRVLEVDARSDARGAPMGALDCETLLQRLLEHQSHGATSVAVVLLNAHKNGVLERTIGELAEQAGYEYVALSHEVVEQIGFLARGDTTTVDAYLTPLIRKHLETVVAALPGSRVRLMQSSGGLTSSERLRGPGAILSGPAGGVVAFSRLAQAAGHHQVIGFDMGGTSTDVSRFAGQFERTYETEIAGVRLRAPMLAIHTVAAGGGSLCRYDGHKFTVGPLSAGADPGPLCYGSPRASEPTVTDVNLVLGRLQTDRFPFPLAAERAASALETIAERLASEGHPASRDSVAEGFFEIANLNMAEAIRQVSIAKGYDVREHSLFVFGGAGGQHACAIAAKLGMRAVLFHKLSGVLSAYGMGLADITLHAEADVDHQKLSQACLDGLSSGYGRLESQAVEALAQEGFRSEELRITRLVDLRYRGTETSLTLAWDRASTLRTTFDREHTRQFGYARLDHPVEVVEIRIEVTGKSAALSLEPPEPPPMVASLPAPLRQARLRIGGQWNDHVPVYHREQLSTGQVLSGPALVLETTGTIVVDSGFTLRVLGDLMLATPDELAAEEPREPGPPITLGSAGATDRPDPVLLEVMNHLYMSIAEQMGEVLRRTALSTNIRERLDFSCAVFDEDAQLIANAPHIPVHLGAMGESVREVARAHPDLLPGDVFATNDPVRGGSHLPDVTVVTPVHDARGRLSFFVASRGHHADIGGLTPGSMPANSTSLSEEGVLLSALRVARSGKFERDELFALLRSGAYPARAPEVNVADIEAQLAANQLGVSLLATLVEQYGMRTVKDYMRHATQNAEHQVRAAIERLRDGSYSFADQLDSGARLSVELTIQGSSMCIDFSGTSAELSSNLNAPRAVTIAAVIYFLRALVDTPIPLNAGCLAPVSLLIPNGTLLSPGPHRAVVGGNVETSQRIVDVLFGALGKVAASQGTMNNLSFGDDSFGYYETIAGGAGAGNGFDGAWGVHTHMTNTRITDPEVLEAKYPVRLIEFSRRRGSGGAGNYRGGDGLVRELEFLAPVQATLLSERRTTRPFGLAGGKPGMPGRNLLNGKELPGAVSLALEAGDRLRIETPGGGGFGKPSPDPDTLPLG